MNIRVAILGPTGYTGLHLIQLLSNHPHAHITYLATQRDELPDITDEFPQLLGRIEPPIAQCQPIDAKAMAEQADIAFLALPHRAAMSYVPQLLDAGLRVIDLSADYRLSDAAMYKRVYEQEHTDPDNLAEALYGLPELFRRQLAGATLIANPGCYPTVSALAIAPLLQRSLVKPDGIIINAASGVTGAGKNPESHLHFSEHNESFFPYGQIGGHRHQPEINQVLSTVAGRDVDVLFVPHLLPIDRGILATIYLEPADDDVTHDDLIEAFVDAYADEPFVRVRQTLPNVKHVAGTNFCDVAIRMTETGSGRRVIAFSAIDNMIKGAGGQAIQNMHIMFELNEAAGLL